MEHLTKQLMPNFLYILKCVAVSDEADSCS